MSTPKPHPTPAQAAQQEERLRAMQTPIAESENPGSRGAGAPAVPLEKMLGIGEPVRLGGAEFEAAPIPVAKLGRAAQLITQIPEMLFVHVLTAHERGVFDIAATAATLNRLAAQAGSGVDAAPQITQDFVEFALAALPGQISEEQSEAMVSLALLVLSRKNPDITRQQIENDLELPTFIHILGVAVAGSPSLRRHF